MQSCYEHVGFARAFGEFFDLAVLHLDLAAQKIILLRQQVYVPIIGANVHVRSRLFGTIRSGIAGDVNLIVRGANVRVRSRLVATSRARSHLLNIGNVTLDRVRRDEVLFPGLDFDFMAIEFGEGAIFLKRAGGAGKPRFRVQLGGLVDREGVLVVG